MYIYFLRKKTAAKSRLNEQTSLSGFHSLFSPLQTGFRRNCLPAVSLPSYLTPQRPWPDLPELPPGELASLISGLQPPGAACQSSLWPHPLHGGHALLLEHASPGFPSNQALPVSVLPLWAVFPSLFALLFLVHTPPRGFTRHRFAGNSQMCYFPPDLLSELRAPHGSKSPGVSNPTCPSVTHQLPASSILHVREASLPVLPPKYS